MESPVSDAKQRFTDVMVDLETTGVSPDENAVIQIAAVKFNPITRDVDASSMFDRCLLIPTKRFWDEGTRSWWLQRKATLEEIMGRMEDPATVTRDFMNWAQPKDGEEKLRFWSKPSHFDYMFLQSYAKQFSLNFPFDFRETQDQRSFLRGLYWPQPIPDPGIVMDGTAHNALFDVLHQIQVVMWHLEKQG